MRYSILIIVLIFSFSMLGQKPSGIHLDSLKVLILGNSLVYHGPKKNIGWEGSWGMAASAKEKDFVHLLQNEFNIHSLPAKFEVGTFVKTFERNFGDFSQNEFKSYKSFKADLIILKLGENIVNEDLRNYNLKRALVNLVAYLKPAEKPSKVYVVGSFWSRRQVDTILQEISFERSWNFVALSDLSRDKSNMALEEFENKGVGRHPSDEGMYKIFKRVWNCIKEDLEQ